MAEIRPSQRFKDILAEMGGKYPEARDRPPRVRVNKRPTLGFSHSLEEDELVIHISDLLLENSPDEVLRAIAHLILLDAYRGAWSSAKRMVYERHKRRLESDDRIMRAQVERDRSVKFTSRGMVHDLKERFDAVNAEYFRGSVPELNLGWSNRVDRSRWGYTDRERRLIVVNRQLDRKDVPQYIVDYILYHEMLHMVHKGLLSEFGRDDHYVAFYKDERKFRRYEEAERWLKNNG